MRRRAALPRAPGVGRGGVGMGACRLSPLRLPAACLVASVGPCLRPCLHPPHLAPRLPPRPTHTQITTRSKLSSVSWNRYVKSQLITSDYGGLIQVGGCLSLCLLAPRCACCACRGGPPPCRPPRPRPAPRRCGEPPLPPAPTHPAQLWDASTAGEAAQFDEHARRVWSVDFSTTDPMRFIRQVTRAEAGAGAACLRGLCAWALRRLGGRHACSRVPV